MKLKKKLICFDMDDTIINSTKTHLIAYKKAFKNHGLKEVGQKKNKIPTWDGRP